MDKNMINWFEIPVNNFERARTFYETIFSIKIEPLAFGEHQLGMFPYEEGSGKVSGGIMQGEGYTPSADGTLIYLNGNPDLAPVLERVEEAGGQVVMGKKQINEEVGYMALIMDTEGNRVALHSQE